MNEAVVRGEEVNDPGDVVGPPEPARRESGALIRSSTFSGIVSSISVAMNPGATVFTVTPDRVVVDSFPALASWKHASRAIVLVSPNRPDFDAA